MAMDEERHAQLVALLRESRAQGFLGPGPVEAHIEHAQQLLPLLGAPTPGTRIAELGSGGGVPGLVLAVERPDARWLLIEANQRRAAFLERAVVELGWAERVTVWPGRAEALGRDPAARGHFDVVIARSFGPPAATAECGAPLLVVGGRLVVSEPPDERLRWPADGLARLHLARADVAASWGVADDVRAVCLVQVAPCPEEFPRRNGVPTKRPLF
jgi:16S rRNA (guanine527-N7)-methyltransferase